MTSRLHQHSRPRALVGSAVIVAIGVTAVVFTAVMGLAAVILLTLRSTGNVSSANAAFYAAEAGVEQGLYALVGHGSGYEQPTRAETFNDDIAYLTSSGQQVLRVGAPTRSTAAFVARSRTTRLPVDPSAQIAIRERSGTTMRLSVDVPLPADPDALRPVFQLQLSELALDVDIPTLYTGPWDPPDPPPDFRINTWKGQQTDPCFFQLTPTDASGSPADCPGWAPMKTVVQPDDPDVGLPLFPFNFAARPCAPPADPALPDTANGECATYWLANEASGYAPLSEGATAANSDRLMLVRDVAVDESWTPDDTYLLESAWPVDAGDARLPANGGTAPVPVAGEQMFDTTPVGATTFADGQTVALTALPADRAEFLRGATTTRGALSATGPAFERTHADDYLYIDACSGDDTSSVGCAADEQPDGRVSAPWNLEITLSYTLADGTQRSATRRILDQTSDATCVTIPDAAQSKRLHVDVPCLYPAVRFPGFLTPLAQGVDADVRLSVSTNTRAVELQVTLQTSGLTTPLGADEKTTILTLGVAGDSRQTLRTTVYQEETLPVFRRTTVF